MVDRIILIGFMGTGKTTIGRLLAQKIGFSFVDSDQEIEKQTGMSIPDIFARYGEAYFRSLESDVIKSLVKRKCIVVATGGGAPVNPKNFEIMKKNGTVVALDASCDVLWQRLRESTDRPMLHAENPKSRMLELYYKRRPVYQKADMVVNVDGKTPDQIVEEIIMVLSSCVKPE